MPKVSSPRQFEVEAILDGWVVPHGAGSLLFSDCIFEWHNSSSDIFLEMFKLYVYLSENRVLIRLLAHITKAWRMKTMRDESKKTWFRCSAEKCQRQLGQKVETISTFLGATFNLVQVVLQLLLD